MFDWFLDSAVDTTKKYYAAYANGGWLWVGNIPMNHPKSKISEFQKWALAVCTSFNPTEVKAAIMTVAHDPATGQATDMCPVFVRVADEALRARLRCESSAVAV